MSEVLSMMKMAQNGVPPSLKDRHATQIQAIGEELKKMKVEFHDLNVQQIREELEDQKSRPMRSE